MKEALRNLKMQLEVVNAKAEETKQLEEKGEQIKAKLGDCKIPPHIALRGKEVTELDRKVEDLWEDLND